MQGQKYVHVLRRWWYRRHVCGHVRSTAVPVGAPTPGTSRDFRIQPTALAEDDQVKALAALVQGAWYRDSAPIARSR
jgi:hypothetical protein